jgi:hypothetical protein
LKLYATSFPLFLFFQRTLRRFHGRVAFSRLIGKNL